MAIRTIAPFLAYEADGGGTGVPLLAKGTPGTVLVAAADTTRTSIVATAYRLSDGTEFVPLANHHGAVEGFRVDIPDDSPGIWFTSGPVASYQPTVEGSRGERGLPGVNGMETDVAIGEYMATPGTNINAETKVLVGKVLDDGLDARTAGLLEVESQTLHKLAAKVSEAVVTEVATPGTPARTQMDATFVKRGEIEVNVLDFGAVPDGTTDCRAAVMAAINAARGTFGQGGKVVFPPGTYFWMDPVVFPAGIANVTIEGRGAILAKRTLDGSGLFFAAVSGAKKGYGAGGKNLTFRGLRIEGNFAIGKQVALLAAHHVSGLLVEDCVFSQAQSRSHQMDLQGCENVTVQRCTFEGQRKSGGNFYKECIQLDNSTAIGATQPDDPAGYDGLPCRNITVQDCRFVPLTVGGVTYDAPVALGSHYGVHGMWQEDITFRNNTVYAPAEDTTSKVRGSVHFMSARRILIEGNTFINDGAKAIRAIATYEQNDGPEPEVTGQMSWPQNIWDTHQTCDDIKVVGNTFIGYKHRNNSEHIVQLIGGATKNAERITVTGNTYRDSAGGTPSENVGAHMIDIYRANTVRVYGNTTDKCRRMVFCSNTDDVIIEGNASAASGNGAAINVGDSSRVSVRGNRISGYFNTGIYASNIKSLTVSENILSGNAGATDRAMVVTNGTLRFTVTGNDVSATTGLSFGVLVQGSSTKGVIRSNVILGAGTPTSVESGSTASTDGNITT